MKQIHLNTDITSLIDSFADNRDETLRAVYKNFRESFLSFSKNYVQDDELSIDCFQEAVISLYENLAIGRISDQDATVKTYLFALGKHKLLNRIKKEDHQRRLLQDQELDTALELNDLREHNKHILAMAFDQLGQRCRQVLTKFYYNRYSIESIMIDMDYKNENTVKAHKSRCMNQLKRIIKNSKIL